MSDGAATARLLWEVGCEELPAWACEQALAQLPALVEGELRSLRICESPNVRVLVGPRRFAVLADVSRAQRPETLEARGPAYDAAFRDGEPTKACEGFARSHGMTPEQLEVREQDGRRFVFAIRQAEVNDFAQVFPDLARTVVGKLNFGKAMRWGTGEHRFVRPVRWVATLLDSEPVEYDLFEVRSNAQTRTHRFLGPERTATLTSADRYEQELAQHHVVADHVARRQHIEHELSSAAEAAGGEWYDPARVLDEVVHLVEYPTVLTGAFDASYLDLPERVLVTAMQSHQRYLPLRSGGTLLPKFLAVMNGDPKASANILPGYERVLAGRLDDAVFSVTRDRDRGIDDMAAALGTVVFHAKAGSLEDRTARIAAVAGELARQTGVDEAAVQTAARLAKADQVSGLVQEFAELEGFAGGLYAAAAGYDADVCAAIEQQYLPDSADAPVADSGLPALLSLADKIELLVTAFAIGEQPTGSRDPHGLRRAAAGVVRTILEHDMHIDVEPAMHAAAQAISKQDLAQPDDALLATVRDFIDDRVEKLLTDEGVRVDAVRAARGARLAQIGGTIGLARALHGAIGADDAHFAAVLTAVKRCARIVAKADESEIAGSVDSGLFESASERAMHEQLQKLAKPLRDAVADEGWVEAVQLAAQLGPAVDAFFDRETGVMVMADDAKLRANRLALVREVVQTLAPLGDLTELQV